MFEKLEIRPITMQDRPFINSLIKNEWGGEPLIIRTKKYYPSVLEGIVAEKNKKILGFLQYEIQDKICEILVFEVFDKFQGIGTLMLNKTKEIAKYNGCNKLFLMTTNDNLDALRFYQKRGFTISGIHIDSVKDSRAIKPTIGLIGYYGIPVRDEIDLEFNIR